MAGFFSTLFEIIGFLFVTVIVVAIVGGLVIRYRLKKVLQTGMSVINDLTKERPREIVLKPFNKPSPVLPATQAQFNQLHEFGFTPGKRFYPHPLKQIQITAFFKGPFVALVHQHPIIGSWVDMYLQSESAESQSIAHWVTNSPMPLHLDLPANLKFSRIENGSLDMMWNEIQNYKDNGLSYTDIHDGNFVPYYQDFYAEFMQHQTQAFQQGGFSEQQQEGGNVYEGEVIQEPVDLENRIEKK
jgi:hypothetical protein